MSWVDITGTDHSYLRSQPYMEVLRGVDSRLIALGGAAYDWEQDNIEPSGTGNDALVGQDLGDNTFGLRTWITWFLEAAVDRINGIISSGYSNPTIFVVAVRYKTDDTYLTNYTDPINIGSLDYDLPHDWRGIIDLIRAKIDELIYIEYTQKQTATVNDIGESGAVINRTAWTPPYPGLTSSSGGIDPGFYIEQRGFDVPFGQWSWFVANTVQAWKYIETWLISDPGTSIDQAHLINVDFKVTFLRNGSTPPPAPPANWGTFTFRIASISEAKYNALNVVNTDITGDPQIATKASTGMANAEEYFFPSTIDVESVLPSGDFFVASKIDEQFDTTTELFCASFAEAETVDHSCHVVFSEIRGTSPSQDPGELRIRAQNTFIP